MVIYVSQNKKWIYIMRKVLVYVSIFNNFNGQCYTVYNLSHGVWYIDFFLTHTIYLNPKTVFYAQVRGLKSSLYYTELKKSVLGIA